jgi:hypothetical protein
VVGQGLDKPAWGRAVSLSGSAGCLGLFGEYIGSTSEFLDHTHIVLDGMHHFVQYFIVSFGSTIEPDTYRHP